ncbi:MAG TPA: EAL domain-containing protein [Trinickia sp.]|nr:EAL domain-containing protein [Trinickia sp.]
MRFKSLRARIAVVIVLLMLAAQAAAYIVISSVIQRNAVTNAQEQLAVAERVFREVLRTNGEKLTQAATVVAADFGFREAVATHDESTVVSALRNHGSRIDADLVILVDLDGKLIADSRGSMQGGESFPFRELMQTAAHGRERATIRVIDGKLYQLVAVPVKAPLPVAWVAMGFLIDNRMAQEMASLTSLDVSFVDQMPDGRWTTLATTLSGQAPVHERLRDVAGDRDATRVIALASTGERVAVVLQRSLTAAIAPFHRLQSALLVITLCGIALSIVGSVVTARSVTRPIAALMHFTRRVGSGDYAEPIVVEHDDEIGELARAFNRMQDGISRRENRITELAYTDRLTGLPNRAMFSDRLQQTIAEALPAMRPFGVMMMDLDRFKYVNDTLGHPIGDFVLREVAQRLRTTLADHSGLVARLGGDEFAVLLPDDDVAGAERIAVRILKALEQPISIEGQPVDVGASIGIVTFPENGTDMNVLLRRADIAMYVAKRSNAGVARYEARHDNSSAERLSLMSELRRAVEQDQLRLFYQPKVDLATQTVQHVEALVRWDHPVRGYVSPDQFIPFAEQTGYIRAISHWVAENAIRQCAMWRKAGIELAISVNVSARELIQIGLPDTFAALLSRYDVPADRLWIEITESAIMDDPNHAIETLDRLNAIGIRLAIDDFGTGYSSLSYLKRMPVDELKIDKSFVMGMTENKDDETIVRSTIDLAHNMGLKVVAEGVESEAVLRRLADLRCDLAQGFHLSRPLPPERLEEWLRQWGEQHCATGLVGL